MGNLHYYLQNQYWLEKGPSLHHHLAILLAIREAGFEYPPFGSLWDSVDPTTGIDHSGSWLQQQFMERRLTEQLLKLLVTHFLQSLHAAVEQCVGASIMTILLKSVDPSYIF